MNRNTILMACLWAGVCQGAHAQVGDIGAPVLRVGDSFTFAVKVNPGDRCSAGMDKEMTVTQTVREAADSGYVIEQVGYPNAGQRSTQRVALDLSYKTRNRFKEYTAYFLGFPIRTGKSWPTTLIFGQGGAGQADVSCTHMPSERIKVLAGEFDAVPIVCTGQWTNGTGSSMASGPESFGIWYAPTIGAIVKRTIVSSYNAAPCTDIVWELKAFSTPR